MGPHPLPEALGGGVNTIWMWFILKEQGYNQPWKPSW